MPLQEAFNIGYWVFGMSTGFSWARENSRGLGISLLFGIALYLADIAV